ncbi:hypothetical protein [Bradyrhizobium sp. SZCCHNRI1058]|uniref:hypothetical protein n=1 Tax=Bradyrhizobium sp. SZCCHNRI1058 TaxID=3057279 RepID=UPI0029167FB7|nr:hypothetical protein [Bradyrhizobium sp. SZCCHNRI1058]
MTSWCDKLASVPSAGFRFDQRFTPVERILECWHTIVERHSVDGEPKFNITKTDEFNLEINSETGFKYGADATRCHVGFNHRLKVRNVSGAPPVVEMSSTAQQFTKLLPEVVNRLIDISMLLPDIRTRKLHRIGITTTTPVDRADLPPGLGRFIEHIGRPWKGLSDGFSIQLTAEVGETKTSTDRCIHTLLKSERADEVMTVMFDFQRVLKEPKLTDRDDLSDLAQRAQKDALSYFEALAEGSMFDVSTLETT